MTKDVFVAAYRANEKKLYLSALTVLKNTEDAKDAVSDAVLYAWEHLDDLRDEEKFDAWILKITYSKALSAKRKIRRHDDIDELKDSFSYEMDTSDMEFLDALRAAGLDGKTLRIFSLHFMYGYTLQKISECADIPLNTVKSKYYRGLRKLEDMKGL